MLLYEIIIQVFFFTNESQVFIFYNEIVVRAFNEHAFIESDTFTMIYEEHWGKKLTLDKGLEINGFILLSDWLFKKFINWNVDRFVITRLQISTCFSRKELKLECEPRNLCKEKNFNGLTCKFLSFPLFFKTKVWKQFSPAYFSLLRS